MTIYKTQTGEKKSDKDPEVLTEPLTGVKDDDEESVGAAPKLVRVTYFPRRRRTWVNLCLILTALLVLGTGTIAAIFLYRHLSNKVVHGVCGVGYFDEFYHQQPSENARFTEEIPQSEEAHMDFFEEEIEVSEVDLYERLTIPRFDEVEETVVWHDFDKNLTAIVDPTNRRCFIMSLNRTQIAPPRDLIDLIVKLKTRYYMPRASVVREQYRIQLPPMSDLTVLGSIIMRECYWFDTFYLAKYVSGVYKRSVDAVVHPMELLTHVGFFSLTKSPASSHVYKIDIFRQEEVVAAKDSHTILSPAQ
ncbi:integral membrane protein 2B-like isoform X2 [Littorina saxatilis]|uniref:Integral membrane protein 2 n=1 Tax=Littorina saxatilis TaxID=31220 RepID=A0AAN9AQ85_9CAEN